jgi:hypothetical protein
VRNVCVFGVRGDVPLKKESLVCFFCLTLKSLSSMMHHHFIITLLFHKEKRETDRNKTSRIPSFSCSFVVVVLPRLSGLSCQIQGVVCVCMCMDNIINRHSSKSVFPHQFIINPSIGILRLSIKILESAFAISLRLSIKILESAFAISWLHVECFSTTRLLTY